MSPDKINQLRITIGCAIAMLYIGIALCNIMQKDYRIAGVSFLFAIVNILLFGLG